MPRLLTLLRSIAVRARRRPSSGTHTPAGARRSLASFGLAMAAYQISQIASLLILRHVMDTRSLAAMLTAIAIFAVAFLVVDNGTSYFGARSAATHRLAAEDCASIVRLRLQLAAFAALVGLAASLTGGHETATAFAPYAVALMLTGALTAWAPWGRGDPVPLASWIGLRGVAFLGLVGAVAAIGGRLPLWAPGAVECACVICIAVRFRLRLVHGVRLALRAMPGPWRKTWLVGGPPILFQLALSSGAVILNARGRAAETAAFVIGVRILGGVVNGAAYLGGSLFPHLARSALPRARERVQSASLVGFLQLVSVVIGGAGATVACFTYRPLLHLFLGSAHTSDPAALIAILAAGPAAGCTITLWTILIARDRELEACLSLLIGTAFTVLAELALAGLDPARLASWMACSLLVGQVLTYWLLVRSARELDAAERTSLRYGKLGSAVAALAVLPALLSTSSAAGSGLAEAIVTAAAVVAATRIALRLRSVPDRTTPGVAASQQA